MRNPNSSLQTVVDDWIEAYQEKTGPAMAELINFIFRVSRVSPLRRPGSHGASTDLRL